MCYSQKIVRNPFACMVVLQSTRKGSNHCWNFMQSGSESATYTKILHPVDPMFPHCNTMLLIQCASLVIWYLHRQESLIPWNQFSQRLMSSSVCQRPECSCRRRFPARDSYWPGLGSAATVEGGEGWMSLSRCQQPVSSCPPRLLDRDTRAAFSLRAFPQKGRVGSSSLS